MESELKFRKEVINLLEIAVEELKHLNGRYKEINEEVERLREAKLGRIMPLSEAAKYCGITPQAIHYHVKMGNITPVPNSNPMCVYQSDLEWLKVKNKKPKQIRYEKD